MRKLSIRSAVLFAALVSMFVMLFAPPAFAASDSVSDEVAKSTAALKITATAYVRYPLSNGIEAITTEPVQVSASCSGFFVSTVGDLTSAGHCVDLQEYRARLIGAALVQVIKDGRLDAETAQTKKFQAFALENWVIEGASKGSQPVLSVEVTQNKSAKGPVDIQDVKAQVLDFKGFRDGDYALIKADVTGTLPLPIALEDPKRDDKVTSIGYPAKVGELVDANTQQASAKPGTVSSLQAKDGVSRTEVSSDLSGGMSGGPTVDAVGNVLGVNSSRVTGEQGFSFITDTTDLRAFLIRNGITPVPTKSESLGVMWIAVIVGVTLVALVAAVVIWRQRNKRHQPLPEMAPASQPIVVSQKAPVMEAGTKYCPNCGKTYSSEQMFCGTDGTLLNTDEVPPTQPFSPIN